METPSPRQVADRITVSREAKGLSVNALAKESGIPLTTLDRAIRGDENVTLGNLLKLSTALETPLSEWVAA